MELSQIRTPLFPEYKKLTLVRNRRDYYSRVYILFEMIRLLKHRYLGIRRVKNGKNVLSRYYMGYSLPTMKDSLERNNVLLDCSAKLYYDLATWKDKDGNTPIFSFDRVKRKTEKENFSGNPKKGNGEYINLIKSFDFAIDIDSKDLEKAWNDSKRIKEIFDYFKLPYSLRFSGTKGFHFSIDSRYIQLNKNPLDLPMLFRKVVSNIANDESIKTIDMGIYDARRILKLPYSLCNNGGDEYVVLPLSDSDFNGWSYDKMKMSYLMSKIIIKERGLLERDFGLDEKQLKSNFLRFIGEYS